MSKTYKGTGDLLRLDGTLWRTIQYSVTHDRAIPQHWGEIKGFFERLDVGKLLPFRRPFEEFAGNEAAWLKLSDGQWWACNIFASGRALNRGGLHPPSPLPPPL